MISYSTNWMGPCNARFFEVHGPDWHGGRIDIYDVPGEPYNLEYRLPIMDGASYQKFSDWLEDFKTEELVESEMLFSTFEQETGHKIVYCDVKDNWYGSEP